MLDLFRQTDSNDTTREAGTYAQDLRLIFIVVMKTFVKVFKTIPYVSPYGKVSPSLFWSS
jgi:hypothetical protein